MFDGACHGVFALSGYQYMALRHQVQMTKEEGHQLRPEMTTHPADSFCIVTQAEVASNMATVLAADYAC